MQTVATDADIKLPADLAVCPKCGAAVIIEEITEWEQTEDGTWQAGESGVSINCVTEPDDLGSDEWDEWFRWHWEDMPYVYWLPLSMKVYKWLSENYRFDMSDRPKAIVIADGRAPS